MGEAVENRPGLLKVDRSLLLVVDMQTRLLSVMPTVSANSMLNTAVKLLTAAALLNVPVLVTEQYPKGLGPTSDMIGGVLPEDAQSFEKTAFSCCGSDNFRQALAASGRRQVVVVGQETHVCVLQTAFELLQQGYQVFVVEDAVCSRLDQHKANALQRMQQFGVSIVCHESVLFEWLRDAKHTDFKAISALVR
ncbi:hydrolase [Methylomonas sp. LL1]|uniref:hydrolase n=1 Tax=Methylomonas sp. LL1 TaxID=2785785 RepID=UPI0018C40BF7|nr:hydrolase [Methylomonas sp. LL1]QPK63853.1 hydrolase [Methylomonas sp. LL1]